MVNSEHFELSREELNGRLRWYEKKHGPYIGNRGAHNWKNLFKKPTLQDWLILFLLIMALTLVFFYQRDIRACQEFYNENVCEICNEQRLGTNPNYLPINFTIKEDFLESGET